LSRISRNRLPELEIKYKPATTLIPNLHHKKVYKVDIDSLIFAVEKGMVLRKIHSVLYVSVNHWMKGFMEFVMSLRLKAPNPFLDLLYKLVMNSLYGKLIVDLQTHLRWI
jgi:hypothetical protein